MLEVEFLCIHYPSRLVRLISTLAHTCGEPCELGSETTWTEDWLVLDTAKEGDIQEKGVGNLLQTILFVLFGKGDKKTYTHLGLRIYHYSEANPKWVGTLYTAADVFREVVVSNCIQHR